MKRASIMLLAAVLVLGFSTAIFAETIIISQNFDSEAFTDGYTFTNTVTGIGDAATVGALWRKGPGSSGTDYPTVSTEHARSGEKSVRIMRNYPAGHGASLFQGYTTLGSGDEPPLTPITSGQFVESFWLYRSEYGCLTAVAGVSTSATNTPGLFFLNTNALSAYAYNGTAWAWSAIPDVTVPIETWIGIKLEVDLDALKYNVWYDDGNDNNGTVGFTKVASDIAMEDKAYTINAVMFNPQGGLLNHVWIDDVELRTGVVPEPGTMMLLAGGLIGLLCYAWKKRK